MPAPRTAAFADLWEMAVDCLDQKGQADRDAVVIFGRDPDGTGRCSYALLESNANRFANHLHSLGVEPGDRIALYLENRPEYLEAMLGAYKVRAVPINVNFRYVEGELRHLLGDAEARVVLHEAHFADPLQAILPELPSVEHTIEMGDGYDRALASASDARPEIERSGDDRYILYTGGTTGLPKGVVWRQEDAFYACLGGGDPMRLQGPVTDLAELPDRMADGFRAVLLAPFMHAAGSWVTLMWNFAGGTAILPRGPLDPELVWDTVDAEGANLMTVIGDAVGRPVLDAWLAHPGRWKADNLFSISNGGAPMSSTLKTRIVETFPNVVLADGFGSSEAGAQGSSRLSADDVRSARGVSQFQPMDDTTVVLGADDQPLPPRVPRDRAGRPDRSPAARVPQRPGQDGGDLRHHRRPPVAHHRRPGPGRRRRHHRAAGSRFGHHQHRWGEGPRRGGRVGAEGAPLGVRRDRRRGAGRALGHRGVRRGAGGAGS